MRSRRFTVSISGHGQRMGDETGIVMQKRQRLSQLPGRQRLAATNR
jgi:hypothetical protein